MKNRDSDDGRGPRRSAVQMTGRTNPAGTETIRGRLSTAANAKSTMSRYL